VQLDAGNGQAHYDLASTLVRVDSSGTPTSIRAAVRLMPDSADAHNGWASRSPRRAKLDEAIDEFQRALTLAPSPRRAAGI
jgi:Tfp pilus assembly protein PilF